MLPVEMISENGRFACRPGAGSTDAGKPDKSYLHAIEWPLRPGETYVWNDAFPTPWRLLPTGKLKVECDQGDVEVVPGAVEHLARATDPVGKYGRSTGIVANRPGEVRAETPTADPGVKTPRPAAVAWEADLAVVR